MRARLATVAVLLAGTLTACGGDPTGTGGSPDVTCAGSTAPLCTDAAYATAVRLAVADAGDRILPALSAEAVAALADELAALEAALDAGHVTDGLAAAASLRDALAARRTAGPASDLASLDAIALAVMQAELALGATPAALSRSRSDQPDQAPSSP